jgi:Flp pilus assembly protein TadG
MRSLRRIPLWACREGATAVEFAMLAAPFLMVVLGVLGGGLLMYSASNLRYAAEGAARCYSVATATCSSVATTQTYASGLYSGPSSPAPTFTASIQACGHQVVGNLTYVLSTGVAQWSIPLSATACFP